MYPLTIITTCSAELDIDKYFPLYMAALLEWNKQAFDKVQLIVLLQRNLSLDVLELISESLLIPVDLNDPLAVKQRIIKDPNYETVNGYPIWDVMKTIREVWPLVHGEYVTFNHLEFIWGPNRLQRTLGWLDENRPIYALGNLRRPGTFDEVADLSLPADNVKRVSDWLVRAMENNNWELAEEIFEMAETTHWMYWTAQPQKPGRVSYIEDAFIASKAWLDAWGFSEISYEMPFQDVYDLMGVTFNSMYMMKAFPQVYRMPQWFNKLWHLWHPRNWESWSEEIRDWFMAQPERWKGTRFIDQKMWGELIDSRRKGWPKDNAPVNNFRHGPGGTTIRWGQEVSRRLQRDKGASLREFYANWEKARVSV